MQAGKEMRYVIHFENTAQATAPAKEGARQHTHTASAPSSLQGEPGALCFHGWVSAVSRSVNRWAMLVNEYQCTFSALGAGSRPSRC